MPEKVISNDWVTVYHGDCREVLASLPSESIDAIVTDPPYGLEFMGKDWDAPWKGKASSEFNELKKGSMGGFTKLPNHSRVNNVKCQKCGKWKFSSNACTCDKPQFPNARLAAMNVFQDWFTEVACECLRVLKPGGHLLAFGGTRTWHRLAVAIEDAGFEVRDSIAWMYGSGFPKSHNLKDDWQGWGTALKPAHEPIVMARKPLIGTVAENVLAHGTGALNIDGCRIGMSDADRAAIESATWVGRNLDRTSYGDYGTDGSDQPMRTNPAGRWPANVILDESQAAELDRQSGISKSQGGRIGKKDVSDIDFGLSGNYEKGDPGFGDTGGASRFFYVAKANKKERPRNGDIAHPTVKPLSLMRYLVRLVTPPDGLVLDPFAGSGATIEAAFQENVNAIGIELTEDYLPLIQIRVDRCQQPGLL